MSRKPRNTIALVLIAVLALAAGTGLLLTKYHKGHERPTAAPSSSAAVSPGPDSETVTATAAPTPATPHHDDAPKATEAQEDAALNAVETMTTWSPGKDLNTTSADLRARKLMTKKRADRVVAPIRPAIGEDWKTAYKDHATSVPTATIDDEAEGPSEGSWVTVNVVWQWESPDGTMKPGGARTYYVTVTDKAPYQVSDYSYEDATARVDPTEAPGGGY